MSNKACPIPRILIERVSDRSMWYAGMVGQTIPFRFQDEEGFWANEPAGYLNVVRRSDARVVFGGEGDERTP